MTNKTAKFIDLYGVSIYVPVIRQACFYLLSGGCPGYAFQITSPDYFLSGGCPGSFLFLLFFLY